MLAIRLEDANFLGNKSGSFPRWLHLETYLCSLLIKAKQVCLPRAEIPGLFPKHRLTTPSRVCRMYKGAQQDPTGRKGGSPLEVSNWNPAPQGRGWPRKGQAVSPDMRMNSSVIAIFKLFSEVYC